MALAPLVNKFQELGAFTYYTEKFRAGARHFQLKGMSGSSVVLFAAAVMKELPGPYLFILDDREAGAYFYTDLVHLAGEDKVLFFPSSYKRSAHYGQVDNGQVIRRTAVMAELTTLNKPGQTTDTSKAIITYPEAMVERVADRQALSTNSLQVSVGDGAGPEFVTDILREYHFEQADFVYEPGQFAVRGSIVDLFSFSSSKPYRIDFFGDRVESIRSFDAVTQLSDRVFAEITVMPNLRDQALAGSGTLFTDLLPLDCVVACSNLAFIAGSTDEAYNHVQIDDNGEGGNPSGLFTSGEALIQRLKTFKTWEMGPKGSFGDAELLEFSQMPQPAFRKNFNLLAENLLQNQKLGYTNYILSHSEKQVERLQSIFGDLDKQVRFVPLLQTLHEGFICRDLKICCYTDHQVFDRYHKYRLDAYQSSKAALSVKELKNLNPGDYVVHIDHGIGRFGGLNTIEVNGRKQEAVRLVYRDNDILYVSIHALHRISKYKGKDDGPPKIYKLGSGAWQALKQKTKSKVKDIAKDLIAMYAKRKSMNGFAFAPDTYLQEELEASFLFEDTPDQVISTKAVKEDMESVNPMDRLICGDVGFGKTEIAIRAAFKAVTDSKQVAVLVPTTILALQHYNTFSERLKSFPCKVEYLSRLKKVVDQKRVINRLKEGAVDIVIGTHRLLGKEIQFKDLGLLIIDEEQKFGVAAKEKLRSLKLNVDTLTLTATPIPRTLQFSLLGARDLSVINTPPPNRYPIATELHTFNDDIIREGIKFELSRGGQVFFIHNRVQNIIEVKELIARLCPGAKIAVAHGQMEGDELEKVMLTFIQGDYDILVSTTIIESGLDIPNANTIFINQAHHFGLSDLHQLRGRVGRSNSKAFCYLLCPPLHLLTTEARRRLKAIEELSDLGSGFSIALQDLDIRGAGNLLGSEQSGLIADLGYETYNRIINEAMQELRENEFRDLFHPVRPSNGIGQSANFLDDCQIDSDLDVYIPDSYIANATERLNIYRELDNLQNEEQTVLFETKLKDRFGPLPDEVHELLRVVKLRWEAVKLGFERLVLRNNKMLAYFVSKKDAAYFNSPVFNLVLANIQQHPKRFALKETDQKLLLTIQHVNSISDALTILKNMSV